MRDDKEYFVKLNIKDIESGIFDFIIGRFGSDYLAIYLYLCAQAVRGNGMIALVIGDKIIKSEVKHIAMRAHHFDEKKISEAISLFKKANLLKEDDEGILHLCNYDDIVCSQTYWAKQKREKRKSAVAEIDNFTNDETVGFVYLVKMGEHYKIGISIYPDVRLKEFTQLPHPLEKILAIRVRDYKYCEEELHKIFAKKRVRGEWFSLEEKDIAFVKDYLQKRKV